MARRSLAPAGTARSRASALLSARAGVRKARLSRSARTKRGPQGPGRAFRRGVIMVALKIIRTMREIRPLSLGDFSINPWRREEYRLPSEIQHGAMPRRRTDSLRLYKCTRAIRRAQRKSTKITRGRAASSRLGIDGLQVFKDLLERHPLHAGKEIHLHGEGGEDVFLVEQAHRASDLTELLPSFQPPRCLQHAVEVVAIEELQMNENLAEFLFRAHRLCLILAGTNGSRHRSAQL